MIQTLDELITKDIHTVAIAGHVHPDGDCIGSTTAVWQYLTKYYPDLSITLYLESCSPELRFLKGTEAAKNVLEDETPVDLFISCDVSTIERIAVAGALFETAGRRICFDHHISNPAFADENYIYPKASSCAEAIFNFIPYERMDVDIASSIYTGIIHDNGVFQYSNTQPETLEIAARLMRKGVPTAWIIDKSVNERTYLQMQVMGAAFVRSRLFCGGQVVVSYFSKEDFDFYGCIQSDITAIVAELRKTTGAEAAVFAYELEAGIYKLSLRSCEYLNVSDICAQFGGGGHVRAAGCKVEGTIEEVLARLIPVMEKALETEKPGKADM